MNEVEKVNQFLGSVVQQYPNIREETQYEKTMKGATEEERQRAEEILRSQVKYFY